MYDIIFIGSNQEQFQILKEQYPTAKQADNITLAKQMCFTKFFWTVWPDLEVDSNFNFDYEVDDYSQEYIHVFKNCQNFDGLCLFPKNATVSDKELSYRFFRNKKEVDIVASTPQAYQKIYVSNYDDYVAKVSSATSDFVWVIPTDVSVEWDFNYYIPYFEKNNVHVFKNGEFYDGVFLIHKDNDISKREFDYRFFRNKKEINIQVSTVKEYDKIYVSDYDDYVTQMESAQSDFVWVISDDIDANCNFNYHIPYYERDNVHVFKNNSEFDGVFICHKDNVVAKREFDYRFFRNKKEIDIVASTPKPYEKIFVKDYDDYIKQLQLAKSKFVWVVPNDIETSFNFDYQIPYWEQDVIHIFKNGQFNDGLFLQHKNASVSQKEFDYRFFRNKKEVDTVASAPRPYNIIKVNNYDDYVTQIESVTSEFVWVVPNDVDVDFDFDYQIPYWEKNTVHIFKNGSEFDGIFVCHKDNVVAKKEFDYRFFRNKKEVDTVASTPKAYDKIYVNNYDTYVSQMSSCSSEFVWVIPTDVDVDSNFNFDYQIPYWERSTVHIFKNGNEFDGLFICHRDTLVSKREFEHRFFVNKKEVDKLASYPKKYQQIYVDNYDDYVLQLTTVTSEFVWVIPNDVEADFLFDYQIPIWEKDNIHIFKNGLYNDGIMIHHKNKYISKREYEFCWYTKKKEISHLASIPKPYDIVFISYNEPNADKHYEQLLKRYPQAKRVDGVKGIHQAHIEAAKLCDTTMFWVIDGDAELLDDFILEYQVPKWQKDNVFVWRSRNPVNNLEYGYGGVKLFPVKETLEMDVTKTDMTTSISTKFNAMPEVSNNTVFNTTEFNTWKSAFRECCKLSSKTIRGQVDNETDERLQIWTTVGGNVPFGEYAIAGAIAGKQYGLSSGADLGLINNFEWLYEQFQQNTVE
jgi:hypothetical protein